MTSVFCLRSPAVAAEYDRSHEYPWEVVKNAHALGVTTMNIAEEYRDVGLDPLLECIVWEEFA